MPKLLDRTFFVWLLGFELVFEFFGRSLSLHLQNQNFLKSLKFVFSIQHINFLIPHPFINKNISFILL